MGRRHSRSGDDGNGIDECRPPEQFVGKSSEVRIIGSPVELGSAQIEIAERATGCDVGERVTLAVAPCLVVELLRELRNAGINFPLLAIEPVGAPLVLRSAALDHGRDGRIANAVGERFPFLYGDPLPRRVRDAMGYRAPGI